MIGVIIFIFGMSGQDGEASSGTSGAVTLRFLSFFGIRPEGYTDAEYLVKVDNFHRLVRTGAHIFEYMVLSLSIGFAITMHGFKRRIRFVYTFVIGVGISLCDEFYQIFVPARNCDLSDVLCDTFGITLVAFLWLLIGRKIAHKKMKDKYSLPSFRREFMSFPIDNISFPEAVDRIMELSGTGHCDYIVTPNADHAVKLEKDKELLKVYEEAALIVPDGTPLLWTADSLGCPLKDRITGADLLPAVCERAAKQKKTLYFLGGEPGVGESAKRILEAKYQGLRVVGTYAPSYTFEEDANEVQKVLAKINKVKPDILVVSLGCPKQEKFIYNHRKQLQVHIALPIGAALDFAAEKVKRAPLWMQKAGFEWLYRFLLEPGRLFRRYFIEDMRVFLLAWKYRERIAAGRKIEREKEK
ncbi:MAG: VanZ family protein [Lachnospiraceae bacterium]|nr:VanZ family protein [Lachnospiraceae bacterium]